MKKKLLFSILAVCVIVGVLCYFIHNQLDKPHFKAQPISIIAEKVKQQTFGASITALGTIVANNAVNITTKSKGVISHIYFKSGQKIKAGQLLVQLEDSSIKARLRENQATLTFAKQQFQRYKILLADHSVSVAAYDNYKSQLQESIAKIEYEESLLAHTKIRAPFSGSLGLRRVSLGEYITPGDSIVNLQSTGSLYVDFKIPEKYSNLIKVGSKISIYVSFLPHKWIIGSVIAIGSHVELATRMLPIRAMIDCRSDDQLKPGAFVEVKAFITHKKPVLTVSQSAISYSPLGEYVYVVKHGKAEQRRIKLGQQVKNRIVVLSGLHLGETVVKEGQIKLHPGSRVTYDPDQSLQ